ncbi:MAG: hypothetical protein RLZZ324_799 [Candidatus Parcubacteria bacterium]|jgi:uncharacterized membrane protein YdfJ with MMPL/SSD domain
MPNDGTSKGGGIGGFFSKLGLAEPIPDSNEKPVAVPPTAPVTAKPHATQSHVAQPPTAPRTVVSGAPHGGASGTVDPQIRAVLEKPVAEAAKPAYSAFLLTMANLADVIPDEATRIKAAIRTLPAGTDYDQLLVDVDECLESLEEQERKADTSAEASIARRIGTLEQQLQQTEATTKAKREQIAALQREIAEAEAGVKDVRDTIDTTRAEIEGTRRDIAATAAAMRRELNDIKAKLLNQQPKTGA